MKKSLFKKIVVSGILIAILIGVHVYLFITKKPIDSDPMPQIVSTAGTSDPILTLNNITLKIEIADTEEERMLGLSNRALLAHDTGLLFVFDKPGMYGFWMKDMNFAIDMIWLDQNFKIVTIKEYATPDSYPESFTSTKPAKYVLETNAGFAREHNLTMGSELSFTGINK